MQIRYRKNEGGSSFLLIAGLGVAGFFLYEWMKNATQVVAVSPLTTNTTMAAQSATTASANPANKYILSYADLQSINNIAVTQLGISNGTASFSVWANAFNLYKGFPLTTSYPDNSIQLTVSEFGNYVNNWASNQGLSGLGTIGANYGPPRYTQPSAGYFGILNSLSRR